MRSNCSLCGVDGTVPIWQALHIPAFLLKLAPFCKLSVGFGSTNQSATPFPFTPLRILLCFCYSFLFSILTSISTSPPHLAVPFSPFPFLPGYNGHPVTHFFREMTGAMSWPDEVRYSSHLQALIVFLLSPLVSTLLSLFLLFLEACCPN